MKVAKPHSFYLSQVCDAYASQLLAYSDKMQEYYENYQSADTNLTENVTPEATQLSGSVETYTEQR